MVSVNSAAALGIGLAWKPPFGREAGAQQAMIFGQDCRGKAPDFNQAQSLRIIGRRPKASSTIIRSAVRDLTVAAVDPPHSS